MYRRTATGAEKVTHLDTGTSPQTQPAHVSHKQQEGPRGHWAQHRPYSMNLPLLFLPRTVAPGPDPSTSVRLWCQELVQPRHRGPHRQDTLVLHVYTYVGACLWVSPRGFPRSNIQPLLKEPPSRPEKAYFSKLNRQTGYI